MSEIITQCLICGSGKLTALSAYTRDHLVLCSDCGLVFSEKCPNQDELDAIYTNYTRDDTVSWSTTEKNTALARTLLSMLHPVTYPYKVLDIACGSGVLIEAFMDENCAVFGTEFDSKSVHFCESKGINMLDGGLMPATDNTFDLIIFTEVIEHIQNPLEVIDNIRRLLSNGGLLYFTTPNFSSLERRLFRQDWGMIKYPEHLAYYTKRSIRSLMTRLNMSEVFLETKNISVFRIIQSLNSLRAKGNLGSAPDTGHRQPQKISDNLQEKIHDNKPLQFLRLIADEILDATGMGSSLRGAYRRSDEE